jgi:hypothetical protein
VSSSYLSQTVGAEIGFMGRERGRITLKDDTHWIPQRRENTKQSFACLWRWTVFLPSLARKQLKLATVPFIPIPIGRGSWNLYWDFWSFGPQGLTRTGIPTLSSSAVSPNKHVISCSTLKGLPQDQLQCQNCRRQAL